MVVTRYAAGNTRPDGKRSRTLILLLISVICLAPLTLTSAGNPGQEFSAGGSAGYVFQNRLISSVVFANLLRTSGVLPHSMHSEPVSANEDLPVYPSARTIDLGQAGLPTSKNPDSALEVRAPPLHPASMF